MSITERLLDWHAETTSSHSFMHQLLKWRSGTVGSYSVMGHFLRWCIGSIGGYKIVEEIAEGGMSTIYKAISDTTHEIVAIKTLFPHFTEQKDRLEKLFAEKNVEGEMASSLDHPNVIRTYSYGRTRGRYYFIMEYINGQNLKDMIRLHRERLEGHKLDIIRQMAQGLSYIHSQGIIHRDICPKNILVSENRDIKIIDFGLAVSTSGRYKGLGMRSGTPSYMAPEQIRALESDERTDIYSFGITTYELLAGQPPFRGEDDFARMQQHLTFEAVPLSRRIPDIPHALEEIVSRAMQKEPDDRYKSMHVLTYDLEKLDLAEGSL